MLDKEVRRQLQRLKQVDQEERDDALWILIMSLDPEAINKALKTLEEAGDYDIDMIIGGLELTSWFTLPPIIHYLEESPFSKVGRDCVYLLGEIASRQGKKRDHRIVPALIQTVEKLLSLSEANLLSSHKELIASCIYALRLCANFDPIPEAQQSVETILTFFEASKEELDSFTLLQVLEILYINDEQLLLERLQTVRNDNAQTIEMLQCLDEFITSKETGEQDW